MIATTIKNNICNFNNIFNTLLDKCTSIIVSSIILNHNTKTILNIINNFINIFYKYY